jgi:hypothetical protein
MTGAPEIADERCLRTTRFKKWAAESIEGIALLLLLGIFSTAQAQQLEPRAYSSSPVGANFLGVAYLYQYGGAALDPSSPITNVYARVNTAAPYYGRTFDLFGRQASVTLTTPYAWGSVHGDVYDVSHNRDLSGIADPLVRFAVNLIGGPAMRPLEFSRHKPETTLGASLTVSAPFGQYDPTRLINIGTNRWAVKPELGISQPVGDWAFEFYAGVWLFTDNNDFFGGQVKRQDPLASYQVHVVYTVRPRLWAAVDFTYYAGGSTTVNGVPNNDRQDNTRGGVTLSVPVTLHQSLKLTWARGVSTRIGTSFDTLGAAWQFLWF